MTSLKEDNPDVAVATKLLRLS